MTSYEVVVGTSIEYDKQLAVARASRKLTGHGKIQDVQPLGVKGHQYDVQFTIEASEPGSNLWITTFTDDVKSVTETD